MKYKINLFLLMMFVVTALSAVFIGWLGVHKTETDRPSKATAWVQVSEPINDVAAVVLIRDIYPHVMPTPLGDAEITRGSEVYIKAPDSLRGQLRISSRSRNTSRCVDIMPARDYGWKVTNVHTRRECKRLHYANN